MKKLLSLICVMLSLCFILCSCGEDKPKDDTSGDSSLKVKEISNISEYTIVRSDNSDKTIRELVTKVKATVSDATGADLALGTDYGSAKKYEIIIGKTRRDESNNALELFGSDYDYVIKLDGNRIVIIGATNEMTATAVDVFLKNFVKDGKVYAPSGDGYSVIKDFPVKNFTVEGVNISSYMILYQSSIGSDTAKQNYEYAEELASAIADKVGISLDMNIYAPKGAKLISVDTTSLDYTKGSIKIEDGNITLCGSYHSIDAVIEHFLDNMIGENETVELKNGITDIDTDDLPEIYSKDDLMKVLQYSYDNNDVLIVGDEINNSRQMPSTWLDIYKNGDGEKYIGTDTYPALLGIDLGRCGFGLYFIEDHEWASVSQMVCEVIDYAAQGGIVTIGSHFNNPAKPENTYADRGMSDRGELGTAADWDALITEGTDLNTAFMKELERCGIVLKALEDAGVPIIWRPLHEVDGLWFWWGPQTADGTSLDTKYYVELWKYIYNYLTDECGLNNLIWHYSPSISENCAAYYPGDEYADIVGCDWYTGGDMEILTRNYRPYEDLMNLGKITNLAEIGISSGLVTEDFKDQESVFSAQSYFGMLTEMYREEYKVGFFATYNDVHSLAFLPGGEEFMKSEMVIDLSEMPELFKTAAGYEIKK